MLKILLEEFRSIDTRRKALRSFGLLVGGIFLAIALVVFWRAGWTPATAVFLIGGIGAVLFAAGLLAPGVLKPFYLVWMALAVTLGFVMTRVLLTVVFYLVITPIGLVMRLTGRDPLNRKLDPDAESYWIPKEYEDRSPERLEKYY